MGIFWQYADMDEDMDRNMDEEIDKNMNIP
jgi:hypothetical protein